MRFIFSENTWSWFERLSYRGAIGIFYESTLGGVLAWIIAAALVIFAVIGIITTFKVLFGGRKPKKITYDKWEKNQKKQLKKNNGKYL